MQRDRKKNLAQTSETLSFAGSAARIASLLHRHYGADRISEKNLRAVSEAAGCNRVTLDSSAHIRVHSKIKAAQPHEIRHVHFVIRRTMVPLFIRYHKLTSFRRITLPARGARRADRPARRF
jgi:hypothetical protein